VRDGTIVYSGRIGSLRRFQDDVREVESGYECGVVVEGFPDVKEGDMLEAYETESVERAL
jgi:translation initiation factor IF-2